MLAVGLKNGTKGSWDDTRENVLGSGVAEMPLSSFFYISYLVSHGNSALLNYLSYLFLLLVASFFLSITTSTTTIIYNLPEQNRPIQLLGIVLSQGYTATACLYSLLPAITTMTDDPRKSNAAINKA